MEARIFNGQYWVSEHDAAYLVNKLDAIVKGSGFTVLNYTFEKFHPYGYTGLWLLAESHLAVHTFPEAGKAYIEISSCNEEKFIKFDKAVRDALHIIKEEA